MPLNGTILSTNVTADEFTQIHTRIAVTVIYAVIFVASLVGNISTCIVIWRNRSMHTTTNLYLFSLAISDMLLLVAALPTEVHEMWRPGHYVFGQTVCITQSFAAEMAANATVLTIVAFSLERYTAVCRPLRALTLSCRMSRVLRCLATLWAVALCTAVPQAMQFDIETAHIPELNKTMSSCTWVRPSFFRYAFQLSSILFFVAPITLLVLVYTLMAIHVRRSCQMHEKQPHHQQQLTGMTRGGCWSITGGAVQPPSTLKIGPQRWNEKLTLNGLAKRHSHAQNRVTNMLIAVVIAFVICWAPFHAERLLSIYLKDKQINFNSDSLLSRLHMMLYWVSGILYFISTAINPILYNLMSQKFRKYFKLTFIGMLSKDK